MGRGWALPKTWDERQEARGGARGEKREAELVIVMRGLEARTRGEVQEARGKGREAKGERQGARGERGNGGKGGKRGNG